jgi:hypothetical protein
VSIKRTILCHRRESGAAATRAACIAPDSHLALHLIYIWLYTWNRLQWQRASPTLRLIYTWLYTWNRVQGSSHRAKLRADLHLIYT